MAAQGDRELRCSLPAATWAALDARIARTGERLEDAVASCIAEALDARLHSIFQVSTSGALVKGVYGAATTIADVKRHGDIGLGTFVGLDGEGIMLDGQCWRAASDGSVMPVGDDVAAPFWVTARFSADCTKSLATVSDWAHLCAQLDAMRPSGNLFAALRVRGVFEFVHARVACKARPGASLVEATSSQSEFRWTEVAGTLVGFWTPEWARTINVPGFHLHFLSDDRTRAGHVIDIRAKGVVAELHAASDLHLVLPANEEFLRADLSGDPAAALAQAEGGTRSRKP